MQNAITRAVMHLLRTAYGKTGASQGAANVLLAAYNMHEYPIDISAFCVLDDYTYRCAKMVIDLRIINMSEPQELIDNGSAIFKKLAENWPDLRRVKY